MPLHEIKEKECANCNQRLTFEDFCRINLLFALKIETLGVDKI